MRVGITVFATDQTVAVPELARAAEERGYYSLFLPEHTHIPVSRRTPAPTGDSELAAAYARTPDPLVALSAAASVTSTLRLGTGVLLPAQREPLVTAKAIATLDRVSNGRVELGVGFGWNIEEMENHQVDPTTRWARAREHILAMRAIWSCDVASYNGAFVHFSPSWSWPKPCQVGGPPILIGGAARPRLFEHVVEYADGWIPVGGRGLRASIPELERACEAAYRDPRHLRIIPFGVSPRIEVLEHLASLGIDEVVVHIRAGNRDQVFSRLDSFSSAVEAMA